MLEFLKNAPLKRARMIPKSYLSKADYGKKRVILSCDPTTLGVIGADNKCPG
jgi:hypothetical protein